MKATTATFLLTFLTSALAAPAAELEPESEKRDIVARDPESSFEHAVYLRNVDTGATVEVRESSSNVLDARGEDDEDLEARSAKKAKGKKKKAKGKKKKAKGKKKKAKGKKKKAKGKKRGKGKKKAKKAKA